MRTLLQKNSPFSSLQNDEELAGKYQIVTRYASQLERAGFKTALAPLTDLGMQDHHVTELVKRFPVYKPETIMRFIEGKFYQICPYQVVGGWRIFPQELYGGTFAHEINRESSICFETNEPFDFTVLAQCYHRDNERQRGEYSLTWRETMRQNYRGMPPPEVLEKIIEAQTFFDFITIVTLETKDNMPAFVPEKNKLEDPLVMGRLHECSLRFLIAAWGDDINPEDLGQLR